MTDKFSPSQMFQAYGLFWLFMFVVSIVAALGASAAFGVPLWQVADVQLAVNFSVLLFFEALYAILLAIMIVTFQLRMAFVWVIFMLAYAFIAFSPVAAFQIYAFFAGVNLAEQSRIYVMFMDAVFSAGQPVARLVGDPGAAFTYLDKIGTAVSIVMAFVSLFGRGRRATG